MESMISQRAKCDSPIEHGLNPQHFRCFYRIPGRTWHRSWVNYFALIVCNYTYSKDCCLALFALLSFVPIIWHIKPCRGIK